MRRTIVSSSPDLPLPDATHLSVRCSWIRVLTKLAQANPRHGTNTLDGSVEHDGESLIKEVTFNKIIRFGVFGRIGNIPD